MPVMDGFTATRLIRNELGLSLPVLAMTAGVTASERMQCIDAGMNDFIPKPIDVGQMFAAIARHCPVNKSDAPIARGKIAELQLESDLNNKQSVFNLDQLLSIAKDNPPYKETIIRMVKRIVKAGTTPLTDARHAWDEGRARDAARLFHTMRGEIGTLGAQRFAQATLDVEHAILDNHSEQVESLFKIADQELHATLSAARDWLEKEIEPNTQTRNIAALDMVKIKQLQILLTEKNMEACEVYVMIRPGLADQIGRVEIVPLDQAIDRLDFDEAIDYLNNILNIKFSSQP
ncbi:MAG: response regulator [Pseudomonadota bacterium]